MANRKRARVRLQWRSNGEPRKLKASERWRLAGEFPVFIPLPSFRFCPSGSWKETSISCVQPTRSNPSPSLCTFAFFAWDNSVHPPLGIIEKPNASLLLTLAVGVLTKMAGNIEFDCSGSSTFLQRGSPPPPPWRLLPEYFFVFRLTRTGHFLRFSCPTRGRSSIG